MSKLFLPVKMTEIIAALERDPVPFAWSAAQFLRRIKDYDRRTLVCWIETEPVSETVGQSDD